MGTPQDASKALEQDAPAGALTPITPELISRQMAVAQTTQVSPEIRRLFNDGESYRVGSGDILNIVIWSHPELALTPASAGLSIGSANQSPVGNGYNVSADGLIQFPFLGPVKVAGLTEYQVRAMLTRRLAPYIADPQLTVRVQAYRHGRIYIDGEVRTPGLQNMDDIPLTLPEAINRAGGFTEAADRSSIILTRKHVSTEIDLAQLVKAGINPNRILLENGDLLRILNRDQSKVFVLGEVLAPHSQALRDGELSLGEALGDAGGVSPTTSNPRQIYVIRKGVGGKAEIYHLDAASPTAYLLAFDFKLKVRDVVFVDPAPVVRWNRVISMLLPSWGALDTGRSIVRP